MLSRLFARKQDNNYRRFKRPEVRRVDDLKVLITIQTKPKWFINHPKLLVLYEENQKIDQYTIVTRVIEKEELTTKTIKE